eukprot:3411355-Alexandrium_andersonii.AAC.1
MPRALPPVVAELFPPLMPSTVDRVGRVLQAKANVLFRARAELDSASFVLVELADELHLAPLTVLRAVYEAPFDRVGSVRFLPAFRHGELRIDVLRVPAVVPGPPRPATVGARGPLGRQRGGPRSRSPRR